MIQINADSRRREGTGHGRGRRHGRGRGCRQGPNEFDTAMDEEKFMSLRTMQCSVKLRHRYLAIAGGVICRASAYQLPQVEVPLYNCPYRTHCTFQRPTLKKPPCALRHQAAVVVLHNLEQFRISSFLS